MKSTSGRLTVLFTTLFALLLGVFVASLYLWVGQSLERSLERDLAVQSTQFQERFLEELDEVRRGVHTHLAGELESFLDAADAVAEITDGSPVAIFRSKQFVPEAPGYRTISARLADPKGGE